MKRFSPRQIERMMKRLGMKVKPIENVNYVEIHSGDEVIRIENPEVVEMDVSGQKIFQITGGEVIKEEEKEIDIPKEDILLVAQQAGVDEETARKALIVVNGNLAEAIMMLKESQKTK